jgi:hypothetical protein
MSRYTITCTTEDGSVRTAEARNKDEVIAMLCAYIANMTGDRVEVSR